EFPPEINADKLATTDVVPHLHLPLSPQRNQVWCATVQIAWDELRKDIGDAPKVKDCDMADGLARTPFPRSALAPAFYVARMGTVGEGIQQKIASEMSQRFPGVTPKIPSTTRPTDVVLYGFLQKNLPFEVRFDSQREPLAFHAAGGDIDVRSFGFKKLKDA